MIEEENLLENARDLGDYAIERMRGDEAKTRMPSATFVDWDSSWAWSWSTGKSGERATDLAEEVMYRALARGLSFKLTMGNILTLTPPLTLTRAEMDQALDILDACLTEVENAA